ncbi:MAG: endonuclease/exonuclease/phosphatase family protein [Bacteroidales bacterium]|nr:endonuclease/exonuclease/phosphatase family protein [Bacteroidales bacterium]NPV36616.1 endonuclease/exonuclease/phosphatase family protein [Bacteroidales bacterium]
MAFYNIENLFDTIDSPDTDDREFLPDGANQWNSNKYKVKLKNMAEVIGQIGDEFVTGGPSIIGLAEVENRTVLKDLINTPPLQGKGYGIVHFDSPDPRGVDVALLYKFRDFKVLNAVAVPLRMKNNPRFRSRDQLVVSGVSYGDTLHLIVNHWPSRRSGPEFRAAAASLTRHIVDSLNSVHPGAKIIVMGDLNDDPTDPSLTQFLQAKGSKKDLKTGDLFNPMYELFKKGVGSLAYRDAWNLFDQIIVSEPLVHKKKKGYYLYSTRIFSKPFLFNKEGQYAGYPFRTFAGGAWVGGYSDHLPSFIILRKN